ncbi:hypothetical protein [Haloarcula halophila]|uniref:hypothetical protein n=1 Tax=Haloarcula TaxID=2237 RepID=UPI0023E45EC3|nr:hypothetical protein [Halomicroarcula sp. DFY41]
MGLQNSFDILSDIIDEYESRGREIRNVEATADDGSGDGLSVTLDVPVSLCPAGAEGDSTLTAETATLTDNGGLQVEFDRSTPGTLPDDLPGVAATEGAVRVADDGLLLTVELTIDPDDTDPTTADEPRRTGEPTSDRTDDSAADSVDNEDHGDDDPTVTGPQAVRDDSVPPYEDTEYLRALYDAYDTFTEMSREIEMEISAETVRRYMIEAGVHKPDTYDTGSDDARGSTADTSAHDASAADTETDPTAAMPDEQLVTDGIGMPEGVTLEGVVEAVVDASAVYEVQRSLGLERQQTRDLLRELNLIGLVLHRISDGDQQETSYEQAVARIRQCAPSDHS